jgi:hypothetical protein
MDIFDHEPEIGAGIQKDTIHSPAGATEEAETVTGEPQCSSSETAVTCVPTWKMRIFRLIFYF